MKKSLENVHVVIYSKKMLKEAIDRLKKLNQKVEDCTIQDFEHHGNDLLRFHDGVFKVVRDLFCHPNFEITLNDLCEMIIDKEGEKTIVLEVCKWYKDNDVLFCHQDGDKSFGFLFGEWVKTPWITEFKNVTLYHADPEEVEKALISEAKKRGFEDKFIAYNSKDNVLCGNNERVLLDSNGKWAEIIEVDKFADLKKAHAEGKIIQYRRPSSGVLHWIDCSCNNPLWENYNEYRIEPEPKAKMGDYVITELKNSPSPGFSAYQLSIQNSVDVLNAENTTYNFKIISKEKFEELRKEAFECTTS